MITVKRDSLGRYVIKCTYKNGSISTDTVEGYVHALRIVARRLEELP